jgi:hypothetical protein
MTETRLIRGTLTEFFRDLVRSAMNSQEVESSEYTEFYLVNLLERFARPAPGWDSRPLALDYLESFHSPPPHRLAKLKHVGDTALFLAGVFMDRLEREIVSTDYYMALGQTAYGHLADIGRERRDSVFGEMADRFPEFVRVLAEISWEQIFPGETHTVRIYTRWLRTRGKRDAEWLLRHGLVPFDAGSRSRH